MKSLLVSLLLFAFAQAAQAVPVALNEWQSKKLYNVLAAYGLRTAFPAEMQTREWAKPVLCQRLITIGADAYTCILHDNFHGGNVTRTGAVAKKLYDFIGLVNPIVCEGPKCFARTDDIKCIYFWPNKDNPPERRYLCAIDKFVPIP